MVVSWSNDVATPAPGPPRPRWHLVPLVLLLGFGEHCIAHALMPTEPALAQLGLSPMLYGLLTVMPKAGSIFTPALWGAVFTRRPRLALALAPSLLVISQVLLVGGLIAFKHASLWTAGVTITLGFILSSLSKAGVAVLQHACLALLLPGAPPTSHRKEDDELHKECLSQPTTPDTPGTPSTAPPAIPREGSWLWARHESTSGQLVAGLCLNVGCTHLIGACVVYMVPRLLNAYGLIGLQLVLTLPTFVGAIGGVAMGYALPKPPAPEPLPSPMPNRRARPEPFMVACSTCGVLVRQRRAFATGSTCDKCAERQLVHAAQREAVLALGLWRAMIIGGMHALASLSVPLLVTHHFALQSAGSIVALAGFGALVTLPLLAMATRSYRTLHTLLLLVSLAILASAAVFTLADAIGGEAGNWACSPDEAAVTYNPTAHHRSHDYEDYDDGVATEERKGVDGRALLAVHDDGGGGGGARDRIVDLINSRASARGSLGWWIATAELTKSPVTGGGGSTSGDGGGGESGLLCLLSRVGTIGLALCGTVAPVLPLALVPAVHPPLTVGASIGAAYGLLECLSSGGVVALNLLAGVARQAGGFRLVLRGLTTFLLLTLPSSWYARRSVERAVSAMRRTARPRHSLLTELLIEADHHDLAPGSSLSGDIIFDTRTTSSRVRPGARPFLVADRTYHAYHGTYSM